MIMGKWLIRPIHFGVYAIRPYLYRPKIWFSLLGASETCQVLECMSLRLTKPRRVTLKNCIDAHKTRRGLDKYGHIHRKPGGYWTNMAIFTQNPPGIGWIWPFSRETRRGLDEYGHIYRKPGGDWTNIVIFTENPPRIGRIWPFSPKTRWGLDEYDHIHAKPGGDWTNMAISIENPAGMG